VSSFCPVIHSVLPREERGTAYSSWSISLGAKQVTALDRPTPRGSKPTMS
jgi:hypothetical protein